MAGVSDPELEQCCGVLDRVEQAAQAHKESSDAEKRDAR
jgi:MarR family transcriptional regulator for hemolysin